MMNEPTPIMNELTPMMNELTEALDRLSRKENFNDPITPEDRLFLRDIDTVCAAARHWVKRPHCVSLEGGGRELMKIAEQFRAMNPPWFKAISDAASRIRELEDEVERLRKAFPFKAWSAEKAELEAKLRAAEGEIAYLREPSDEAERIAELERLLNVDCCEVTAELRARIAELEAKLAERRPSPEQWMDMLAENDALREKLEAVEKEKDELYNERHLFVAHAIALKAKLQSVEAQVAKLGEVLDWYADYENWIRDKLDEIPAMEDHGARARAALQKDDK